LPVMYPDGPFGMHELGGIELLNITLTSACDCMLNHNYHTTIERGLKKETDREKIFHCLYSGLFDKVCISAFKFCGTEETAKDLTQNVFMRVWSQIDRLNAKIENWKGWENYLFIMAKNEALNYKRKQKREIKKRSGYGRSLSAWFNHDSLLEKECEVLFTKAFTDLTQRQSEVYLLNYYGIKRDAISEKLGITYTTVSNTLNDARRRMRAYVCDRLQMTVKKSSLLSVD
jgi:RNA polymerase sigma factor (sigma-70 family)